MSGPVTFQVEDYFQDFANKSALAEAERFKTVPTGSYTAQVTKREGRYFEQRESKNGGKYWAAVFGDDSTPKPEWRKGVQLTADVFNGDGKKLSNIRIEASWEDKRDEATGKLDQLFNRWSQLKKAVFPNMAKDEQKPIGEVFQALEQFPIRVRISESYKVTAIDGSTKWTTAETEEMAKTFREAGYEPKNFVQAVSKA
jgi:hypothetical protein